MPQDIPAARTALGSAQQSLDDLEDALAQASTFRMEAQQAIHAALTALEDDQEPPPPTDHFTVVDGIIRDPEGAIFRPDGANVTGADSYQWGQEWNAHGKAATWLARGATAVRLVYCTECISHPPGSQHYGELADLVEEYTSAGIVVIIDNHDYDLGGSPPTAAQVAETAERFRSFAQAFGDNPRVWYEPFNEPMDEGQDLNLQTWLNIHRPVCAAIREHTEAPIVVCASMFGQDRPGFGGHHPEDSSLLQGVPHLMAEFGTVVGDLHGYHRWGGATTAADHLAYWRDAREEGVAILVGEMGAWGLHGGFDDEEHQASHLFWEQAPHYIGILPWMTGSWGDAFWGFHAQRMAEPVEDDLEGGEEPPPPGDYPRPALVVATAQPQAIGLAITHPVDIPAQYDYMVVAWGSPAGFVDAETFPRPYPTSYTVPALTNGVQYTVQVGYGDSPANVPADELVTVIATPTGGTTPPPTGTYPRGGSIQERAAWITARAGIPAGTQLQLVGPGNVPQGCQWVPEGGGGNWPSLYVWDATLLEGLDIPARIVPRGATGPDITLRRCRFYDAFTWETGRIRTVEACHSTGPPAGAVAARGWGQANLNALRAGWTVRGTILEGMADNIQQSGGGLVEDSILRNLVVFGPAGSGSHNDHMQNYGGLITFRRSMVAQDVLPAHDSHINSIFCDGGDYLLEDALVLISAPQGSNTWALHAAKGSNSIRVRHTSVRGKTVGNIIREEGADISSPY